MDIGKLKILGEAAKYDICSSTASQGSKLKNPLIGNTLPSGVCHSYTPDGRCVSLLKVLMTNECEKDCFYCPNRAQRDVPRAAFMPEELSKLFMGLYERNYVEGLFLSSGVRQGTSATMENLLKTIEILRLKYRFGGYIHLKLLPGASDNDIALASKLANRISVNLEAPNADKLKRLSSTKDFEKDLLKPIRRIAGYLDNKGSTTQTTQFIVGAARESDSEIISTVNKLYSKLKLKRAYFSAFNPIPDTPLQSVEPAPRLRENRLYQADFMLRFYSFDFKDFIYDDLGNLDLQYDPKLMYALKHPELFPVEVNLASYSTLLKVPGIGPESARKILQYRRHARITQAEELRVLGIPMKRSKKFILVNGRYVDKPTWLQNPENIQYEQLNFFKEISL